MLLLVGFSFLAGLVTILAPCIWPILPIVFSSSLAGGGKKRPLGITLGVILSFSVLTLFISYLVMLFHFNPNVLRTVAVVVIAFLVINYLANRFPSIWEIKIDEKGIEIKLANSGEGKKFYPAENIEGFDIHAETDNSEIKELAIKFKSKLSPLLKISFYSRDELKIKEFLLKFAPEEEISQSAIDSFLKLIRF